MIPKKTLILDAEIAKAIPSKKEPPIEGIEYCAGWTDFIGMGISVVGAFSYETGRCHAFLKDNIHELDALITSADHVVTFNGDRFDLPLLADAWEVHVPEGKHYDLLVEIRRAGGFGKFAKGLNLKNMMALNGLPMKGEHSAVAPVLWQRGQIGTIVEQAIADVWSTKALLDEAMRGPILAGTPAVHVTLKGLPLISEDGGCPDA